MPTASSTSEGNPTADVHTVSNLVHWSALARATPRDFTYRDYLRAIWCIRQQFPARARANGIKWEYDHVGPWNFFSMVLPFLREQTEDDTRQDLVTYRWSQQEVDSLYGWREYRHKQFYGAVAGVALLLGGWRVYGTKGAMNALYHANYGFFLGYWLSFFAIPKQVMLDSLAVPDQFSRASQVVRETLQENLPDNSFVKALDARVDEITSYNRSDAVQKHH